MAKPRHDDLTAPQARRRKRASERYGPLGALAANWIGVPNTKAWRKGAAGEQHVARQLAKHLRGSNVVLIHDRRIPGPGRANIDHLTIGGAVKFPWPGGHPGRVKMRRCTGR